MKNKKKNFREIQKLKNSLISDEKLKEILESVKNLFIFEEHEKPRGKTLENFNETQSYKLSNSGLTIYYPAKTIKTTSELVTSLHVGSIIDSEGQQAEKLVFIKAFSVLNSNYNELGKALKEMRIYNRLKNVSSQEIFFLKNLRTYCEANSIYLALEWVEFTLIEIISNFKQQNYAISESEYLNIIKNLLNSYCTMAQLGILHNNIKTDNILVDREWNMKIINFENSVIEVNYENVSVVGVFKIQENSAFLAPELVFALNHGNRFAYFSREKADVYALGLMFYEILTYNRVEGRDRGRIISDIENFQRFSREIRDFLKFMLTENPKDRPYLIDAQKSLEKISSLV